MHQILKHVRKNQEHARTLKLNANDELDARSYDKI